MANPARWNAEIIMKFSTALPFRCTKSTDILCAQCTTKFEEPVQFREHMKAEHPKINVIMALRHVSSEVLLKLDCTELSCRICSQPAETLADVAKHLKEVHRAKLFLDSPLQLHPYVMEPGRICCGICGCKHAGLRQLGVHMTSHFYRFSCENCGKAYVNHSSLRLHSRACAKEKKFYCQRCNATFNTLDEKRTHIRNKKSCWLHCCELCVERFITRKLKQAHMEEVHGKPVKAFTCVDCGEQFDSTHTYRKHYRLTHGTSVLCPHCGKAWETQAALNKHLVVHTKEKNFTCEHCSKAFSSPKLLKQHSWVHREDKRFSCDVCNKKFNQKVSWTGHMKHHHPEIELF